MIMCLCTQIVDKINLVCCKCKYSRKGKRELNQKEICPNCRCELNDIGSKIAIPKKRDKKRWNELQTLIDNTEYFEICQC